MDILHRSINVSNFFVNKQNVRSFGNIINRNILNKSSEIKLFELSHIEDFVVSDASFKLLQVLASIQENLINKSKNDFKDYFVKTCGIKLQAINKEYIFTNCWTIICDIIPSNFYGSNQNKRIMKDFVCKIIYTMKKQHLNLSQVLKCWDFSVDPWVNIPNSTTTLHHLVLWIVKYIISAIVCLNFYVTTCKLDANENKLYYFWKNEWQSYYDFQIFKMVYTKVLKKYEPLSLGKKTKKNHSFTNRKNIKCLKKDIPKLHLTLKPNNDCRPIVCYKNNSKNTTEKYKIKDRLTFLRTLAGKPAPKIENLYDSICAQWASAGKPKLYFIKTDLSNAFGSINRKKLGKILSDRYMTLLSGESCENKKKRITQQFKDLVSELRKPILIRTGSTVYEWKEGLVQGYKYSPALSELYYNYLDEIYFTNHIRHDKNHVKLFTRVVDDYLYITDSIDDALAFLNGLSMYTNINYDKTVVNFVHDSIKFNEEITFLGYCYNTTTMEVGRAKNIYSGQMCYKIAFTGGLSDIPRFIESRIGQSGNQISRHIFNFQYNSEQLIWKHIFTTFCLSANKFCTILAVICNEKDIVSYLTLYKKKVTVKLTNAMLETLMRTKPTDFMFVYCINHFKYLSWKALFLCAKGTPKCSGMIPFIHEELAKSNCIFGRWREHARRINTSGENLRIAIKEVCRRHDLRMFFKEFEKLPMGFECYHHKRLN